MNEFENLDAVFAAGDLVAVDVPRRLSSDEEIQTELSKIALGLQLRTRCTTGEVTDSFVNGGDFAPGRLRWVQTKAFDSAAKQAAELAASLQ